MGPVFDGIRSCKKLTYLGIAGGLCKPKCTVNILVTLAKPEEAAQVATILCEIPIAEINVSETLGSPQMLQVLAFVYTQLTIQELLPLSRTHAEPAIILANNTLGNVGGKILHDVGPLFSGITSLDLSGTELVLYNNSQLLTIQRAMTV